MKTFSFIIPLILSILCLLYLLFYPCQSATTDYDFSAKVLAKENEHTTISNALFLTTGSVCKEKIKAHEQCFYYVSNQKNITFFISSYNIQYLKIDLLSDTGKHISYQTQKKNNTLLLTLSPKKTDTERIFLCLTNQSVSDCTIKIQNTTANIVTPKPNKSTASNPKTFTPQPDKSTASNSKTVTPKPDKNATLQPQFLLLPPDTSKKITIINYTQINTPKQFTWISTNSNVATVKNNIIITHQEGTAIIYLKDKENANNTSSCLVRVLRIS